MRRHPLTLSLSREGRGDARRKRHRARATGSATQTNEDVSVQAIWSALDRDASDHRPLLPSREKVPGRADEGASIPGARSL